jgi:hypothetical protein
LDGNIDWPVMDDDGFHTDFTVLPYSNDEILANVALQQGMSPQAAADLLRRLASRIERYGHILLNQTCRDSSGYFDENGQPVIEGMQWPVDDDGNTDYVALARDPEAARRAPEGTFVLVVKRDGTGYLQRASGLSGLQHCSLTVAARADSAAIIQYLRTWRSILGDPARVLEAKPGCVWVYQAGSLQRKRQAFHKLVPLLTSFGQPSLHIEHGRYQPLEGVEDVYAEASDNAGDEILIKASFCFVPTEIICDVFDRTATQLEAFPDLLMLPEKILARFDGERLRFEAKGKDAALQESARTIQDRYNKSVRR